MRIRKIVHGTEVEEELVEIKNYGNYSLYQVYKIKNGKRIPMYKTTLNHLDIKNIAKNDNTIEEEVFEDEEE